MNIEKNKKQIAIMGSTGSIGTQALSVIESNPDLFEVYTLTANNNADLLISQAVKFLPDSVVIANKDYYAKVRDALSDYPVKVYAGDEAISQVVVSDAVDIVISALVGYSGLAPTMRAISAGKTIALANKETLVVAGELIKDLSAKYHAPVLPVDSEHSAIFQCLEYGNEIDKLFLTASGGPFRNFSIEELESVTKEQALNHPNWCMGAKVTIDSASMMNKGFEVIEAKWLFDVDISDIEVLVHPQSIIHSMIQYKDGSVKAQLGMPDMKLPIQYALTYPKRIESSFERIDFSKCCNLTFEKPDMEKFKNLKLAYEAMRQKGNMPCILNAANEVAVEAFLNDRISFLGMSALIEKVMEKSYYISNPDYENYIDTDRESRLLAKSLL